jgi:hypothetical protein
MLLLSLLTITAYLPAEAAVLENEAEAFLVKGIAGLCIVNSVEHFHSLTLFLIVDPPLYSGFLQPGTLKPYYSLQKPFNHSLLTSRSRSPGKRS